MNPSAMDFTGLHYGDMSSELLGYEDGSNYLQVGEEGYGEYPVEGEEAFNPDSELVNVDGNFSAEGEYQETQTVLVDGGDRFGVSALAFDCKEELAWMGNSGGHVTSYYRGELMKYTSFQMHVNEEIRELLSIDAGILGLTPTSFNLRSRQGLPMMSLGSIEMENMQCMLQLSSGNGHRFLVGGHQSAVVEFDLSREEQTQVIEVGSQGCVILRDHPRFVCHGDLSGRISLHDPRTLREEHSFQAHSGSLSDFDVLGNHIVTCGFSNRMGSIMADQFAMVFDLRMMKMSLPLRAMSPPFLLQFVPGMTELVAAVSSLGQWQLLDVAQPGNVASNSVYHVSRSSPDVMITSMKVSSSSQTILFGDNLGSINLFTSRAKPIFNEFSNETVMPDPAEHIPTIAITDNVTSLASVPLNYPTERLLSDWPAIYMKTKYRPTPTIDSQILQSMKMVGSIGYAPNTFNRKRNQVQYRFIRRGGGARQPADSPVTRTEEGILIHVPRRYLRIELKFGKMGLEDIDYDHYNRTSFSGLEMLLANSYCNPMLQMFYYIAPLRATVISHLCDREFCLVCELGFLFHMLDISVGLGVPCHASNFLRAFRTIPEAAAMGLTLADQDSRTRVNLGSKIQSWNRFVLQQLHSEMLHPPTVPPEVSKEENVEDCREFSPVADIFGAHTLTVNRCTRCHHETKKEITSLMINLMYPDSLGDTPLGVIPFHTVVTRSMCLQQVRQAWCDTCTKYQLIEQTRQYRALPNAIAMNCGLDNAQDVKFWRNQYEQMLFEVQEKKKKEMQTEEKNAEKEEEQITVPVVTTPSKIGRGRPCRYGSSCSREDCHFSHYGRETSTGHQVSSNILNVLDETMDLSWVPLGLQISRNEDGSVTTSSIAKEELDSAFDDKSGCVYELVGVISHVGDPNFPDKNNLVGRIRVGPGYHDRGGVSPVSHWYLFNDISIQPINPMEAVWFPLGWQTPCILYWVKKQLPVELSELQAVCPVTADVFLEDKSLAQRGRKRITFTPLTSDEMPNEGDLVAMDAEFVNLHQEEAEIRSDGTRTTVRPSHKAVGRITCIRGQGPLEGTPFLDDYISTQEQVVDYLTKFSGIKPGDLDANFSQKHLTTLKSTYLKLRYLIDRKVKFVGHGLKNDLRVINLVLPQSQLIDTVHLFHMAHNRMVSLKFLAWHFLKLKIQSVVHDSIEDARTAMALYQKYSTLKEENVAVLEIQKLYELGKKVGWKVPGDVDDDL